MIPEDLPKQNVAMNLRQAVLLISFPSPALTFLLCPSCGNWAELQHPQWSSQFTAFYSVCFVAALLVRFLKLEKPQNIEFLSVCRGRVFLKNKKHSRCSLLFHLLRLRLGKLGNTGRNSHFNISFGGEASQRQTETENEQYEWPEH